MFSLSSVFDLKLGTKSAMPSGRNREQSLDVREKAAYTAHVEIITI